MMPRFTVFISDDELAALKADAAADMRDFRAQARLLIRRDLERRGLLPEKPTKQPEVSKNEHAA